MEKLWSFARLYVYLRFDIKKKEKERKQFSYEIYEMKTQLEQSILANPRFESELFERIRKKSRKI